MIGKVYLALNFASFLCVYGNINSKTLLTLLK